MIQVYGTTRLSRPLTLAVAFYLVLLTASGAQAQSAGAIVGNVTDAQASRCLASS